MRDSVPDEDGVTSGDRRSFLRKAGVAAGVAWVAPTVLSLSSPAAAATGGGFKVSIPFGPGNPVPLSCNGGVVRLTFVELPDPWTVIIVTSVPIEIVSLSLVPLGGGATIVSPLNGPPDFPVTTSNLTVHGTGVPQVQSFFDLSYNCAN